MATPLVTSPGIHVGMWRNSLQGNGVVLLLPPPLLCTLSTHSAGVPPSSQPAMYKSENDVSPVGADARAGGVFVLRHKISNTVFTRKEVAPKQKTHQLLPKFFGTSTRSVSLAAEFFCDCVSGHIKMTVISCLCMHKMHQLLALFFGSKRCVLYTGGYSTSLLQVQHAASLIARWITEHEPFPADSAAGRNGATQ